LLAFSARTSGLRHVTRKLLLAGFRTEDVTWNQLPITTKTFAD